MNHHIDPNQLVGVWSRKSIRWQHGSEDKSTQVWWIQARPHFGDIRIPPNRPSFAGIHSLQECDAPQKAWLNRQQGFAGTLVKESEAWVWQREINYPGPTTKRDIGRLRFTDPDCKIMIEDGVEEPYTEIWQRIDDAASTAGQALVLKLDEVDDKGLLVAIGDHFIFATIFSQCVEISHGVRKGPMSDWLISHSTDPWREGKRLFNGSKTVIDRDRRTLIESKTWTIAEPAAGSLHWVT